MVEALIGIAKSVLQQLGSPALAEFRLLWGHKEDFEKLEDTVSTIRNVLQDADRKQATDVAVQGWLARLRVVLYDADDLFDAIAAKFLLEKAKKGTQIRIKVRCFVSKPYRFAYLVKNAHKVKEIREHFDDIAANINKFNFLPITTELGPTSRIQPREETHSFVPRNEVVGREQETEDVVRMLLSEQINSSISVIGVIGIGGLGKTTLVQLVYNDERVKQGFDFCMWACINYLSDLKQVLMTLLKSIPLLKFTEKSELNNLNLDQLQSSFRKEIEGKCFLLVLDDLWDEDPVKWDKLKQLLSSGKDGTKILTTTRSEIVAQSVCATKPYFHLQGMTDESAWLLFKNIALGEEGDCNSLELEQFGREIVRKCANVPLAIITIASLLRGKEKEMWYHHVNNELSIVFPDHYKRIMYTLEISYKELSYPLKRCFGYCSLFPKDFKFEKGYLVSLWIAQGFVEPLNQCFEDRAEEYFLCLVDRCFFQLTTGEEESTKGILTYHMHDLMHDLATEVSRSESILVDNIAQGSWDKTIRHVSINCDLKSVGEHVSSFSHSKSLRTFLRLSFSYYDTDALKKLFPNFKSLRVLDLSGNQKVPSTIGELIHLRFLDLSGKYSLKRLPSSIGRLPHLQCLILKECSELEEFPKEMGDLLSLRFLDLSNSYDMKRLPRTICSLLHLKSLILQECKHLKELPEDLGNLLSLRLLDLSGNYSLERLPGSICSLCNLQSLILQRCKHLKELPEDLGNLLSLRLLDLSENYSVERLPGSICSLCNLKSLILRQCEDLKELPEDLGKLLSLRHLVLEGCRSLVKMPPGLVAMTSLITLDRLVVHNPTGGLKYLEKLDNLTGSLQIEFPSTEWEGATKDAEKSSLSKKIRIHSLTIICKVGGFREESVVNALQLPPNLVDLSIQNVGGNKILHGVSRLHKLVILNLKGCKTCVQLPPLSHLSTLKELWISDMVSVLAMEESYEPNSFFPSLETLSIKYMWNLTGWWLQAPAELPTFPRLTRVCIRGCQRLTRCLPLFPLVEDLELEYVREEIIWHIIGSEAASTSTSHRKSVLKKLKIYLCVDLHSIAEAQIRHLSALQNLHIIDWNDQLESIALNGLACLTSLEQLRIDIIGSINWGGQEAEVRRIYLPRVRELTIPTMNRNLLEGLKHMSSLETLSIRLNFHEELQEEHEEEGLPWKHLQKLHELSLAFGEGFSMRNNQRLLNGLQDLTTLKQLNLSKCKELYLSWRALLGLPNLHSVWIGYVEDVIDVDSDDRMIQTQPISRFIPKQLEIVNCSGEWVHDIPWKSLPFLTDLRLTGIRNFNSLPEGIQHLSALKSLRIIDNPGVVSLPHWMSSLSSLQYFGSWGCSEELKKRCSRLTGEDWPNIQHIERIFID